MDDLAAILTRAREMFRNGERLEDIVTTALAAAAIAPRLTPDREALDHRAYRIVERAAHMGGCSQTHHEHLTADAKRVLVALDEAQRLAASPDAPRVAGLDVERLARAMLRCGMYDAPGRYGDAAKVAAEYARIGDTATPATSDEP